MTPLPIDPELRDVIKQAKQQIAGWGKFSFPCRCGHRTSEHGIAPAGCTVPGCDCAQYKAQASEFKSIPVDLLVTRDDKSGRDLADALRQCMNLTEHSMALSHHRRLVAITLIHALDEIDRLRAAHTQ